MPGSKLVYLLYESWKDLDRVLDGLTEQDATSNFEGSSFAWTCGHVAQTIDAWINVRFQHRPAHSLLGEQRFRFEGTGVAEEWATIRTAERDVRAAAKAYLDPLHDRDLDLVVPYDGSHLHLRKTGLGLRYALIRNIAHHYFHIGEIATKRACLGHDVGDYPGYWEDRL